MARWTLCGLVVLNHISDDTDDYRGAALLASKHLQQLTTDLAHRDNHRQTPTSISDISNP